MTWCWRWMTWVALVAMGRNVAAAGEVRFDPEIIVEAVRDGQGRIWGASEGRGLVHWSDGRWQRGRLTAGAGGGPHPSEWTGAGAPLLATNLAGVLHAFWAGSASNEEDEVTWWAARVEGPESSVRTTFQAVPRLRFVTFDGDGVGWLTGHGPQVYRVGPELQVTRAVLLSTNQMVRERFDLWSPLRVLALPGRPVWLWGQAWNRELAVLPGFMEIGESGAVPVPAIDGLPLRGFLAVTPVDRDRVWASVPSWEAGAGLYEIDLGARRARRLPEPAPSAWDHVHSIDVVGADRYVVGAGLTAAKTLWRWRDGNWTRITDVLESANFDDFYPIQRPWLAESDGVWGGTGGQGLQWISHGAPVTRILVDWKRSQPLETVHRIFPHDGRLVLVGFRHGTAEGEATTFRQEGPVARRLLEVWKGPGNLQVDAAGNLWTLWDDDLARWDGSAWKRYRLPEVLKGHDLYTTLGRDTAGGLWVTYRHRHWIAEEQRLELTERMLVFDPVAESWRSFDSLEAAYENLGSAGPTVRLDLPTQAEPAFGGSGKITFMGRDASGARRSVHYFDGARWRHWPLADLKFPPQGYPGLPFFAEDGLLRVNFSRSIQQGPRWSRQWDGTQWAEVPWVSGGRRDPEFSFQPMRRAAERRQAIEATTGVRWAAGDGNLQARREGLVIPQFAQGELHPFLGRRQVDGVWVDARGHLVLSTTLQAGNHGTGRWYVVLQSPTGLEHRGRPMVVRADPGAVEVDLAATGGNGEGAGEAGFTAVERIDDQLVLRWNAPGLLEVAERVEGPWTALPNVHSPVVVRLDRPHGFFRVRR